MMGLVVSSWALLLVALPIGVSGAARADTRGARALLVAPASTLGVLLVASALSGPLLRALSLSGPSFELGAASSMLPLAVRRMVLGTSSAAASPPKLLGGPAVLFAGVAFTSRFGHVPGAVASLAAMCVAAALLSTLPRWETARPAAARWIGRLSGALLLAVALELAYHSFTTV